LKNNRLFKIIFYILKKGHTTAPELAKKFEVSVRTIYRDIDVISDAGIPIYTELGRNGGIRILDSYVLEKTFLSDDEKKLILSSLQSLSVLGKVDDDDLLTKLSSLFNTSSKDWFEVDFSRWGNSSADNLTFECLKKAVTTHKAVLLTYVGQNGQTTTRKIHPLKLFYKSRNWYVKAYCTSKSDFRLFKLTRIATCTLLEETFIPLDFPNYKEDVEDTDKRIVLRFPKEAAYRVYDEFSSSEITKQDNGDLITTSCMPEDPWLIGFLLSFGVDVEILEPIYLRKTLSDIAKKVYQKNKS